jgi:hypothetical protein
MPFSSPVTAGTDVVIGDHNNLRKDLLLGGRVAESVASAATVTLDFSDVTKGNIKTVNLTQSINLRFSGILVYPTVFFVRFVQNSSGGWVVTILETGIKYPGQEAPVIANGANEVTGLMFVCTAAGTYDCYYAGFGLLAP